MKIIHHELGRDKLYKTWHTIDGAMIIYTYTDGGNIVFSDHIFPIAKGALCYISPSTSHYTMPDAPSAYDRSKIFISVDDLNRLLSALPESSEMRELFSNNSVVYAQIPQDHQERVEEIFQRSCESLQENDIMNEQLLCSFLELMIYLKKYTVHHVCIPSDLLSRAVAYINRHYSKNITLEDICREVYVSKYYFCRKFKDMMGMTVMEYISKTRLSAAKAMLKSSNMSIEAISERCGFSSVSYFSQSFKKQMGISATKYRKSVSD